MYYIEIKSDLITAKAFNCYSTGMIETTKEIYDAIEWFPAKPIYDDNGIVINVEMIGEAPVEETPMSLEEQLELKMAQNTAETLELVSFINEQQKLEQAKSSAELIELIMSMKGDL